MYIYIYVHIYCGDRETLILYRHPYTFMAKCIQYATRHYCLFVEFGRVGNKGVVPAPPTTKTVAQA